MPATRAMGSGNPVVREWYQALMQPDNPAASCCGEADAYWADSFEVDGDRYVAIITDPRPDEPLRRKHVDVGTRIVVPNHKLKYDQSNPTGHGIIFLSGAILFTATSRRAGSDLPGVFQSEAGSCRIVNSIRPSGSCRQFSTTVMYAAARKLIDDFARLAACRLDRQREYLRLLRAGNPVRQIPGSNEHVHTSRHILRWRRS